MMCPINKQRAKPCQRIVAYLAPIRLDMAIPISVLTPNFLDAAAAALGQLLLRARNQLLTPYLRSIMCGPQNKLYCTTSPYLPQRGKKGKVGAKVRKRPEMPGRLANRVG